ncbi:hypothetical protein [Bacillus badius]|uniref:hypothetical protein n=1 Tax=Bacillus badius TaxID=1455 RepID=UPI000596DFAD|nr:hypothetical protein [Bacillus badius]KIL74367.1 hypothetical protein SD78_1436 [Bacillus badius]
MSLKSTSYTNKSVDHFIIDAGAVYKNFEIDPAIGNLVSGELIGATEGGNEFAVETEIRNIAVDGMKGRGKGLAVKEFENPTLLVNLKEVTAQTLALTISGSNVDTTTNSIYDIITTKGTIELTDYLENVALVGRLSDGQPIIVVIENVISIEGLEMKTQDGAEVVIPVKLAGHYDETHLNANRAPYKIYYPKAPVAPVTP